MVKRNCNCICYCGNCPEAGSPTTGNLSINGTLLYRGNYYLDFVFENNTANFVYSPITNFPHRWMGIAEGICKYNIYGQLSEGTCSCAGMLYCEDDTWTMTWACYEDRYGTSAIGQHITPTIKNCKYGHPVATEQIQENSFHWSGMLTLSVE